MFTYDRKETLEYLNSSGAVRLLESLVETLLKEKPRPELVLHTLREAATDWTPKPIDRTAGGTICCFQAADGASWKLQVQRSEGCELTAHADGRFVRAVGRVTFDPASKILSLLGVKGGAGPVRLPDADLDETLSGVIAVCDNARIPYSDGSLRLPTCDGSIVRVVKEDGVLTWYSDDQLRGPVREPSCDARSSRLSLDKVSDGVELSADCIRAAVPLLEEMCEKAGVAHHLSSMSEVVIETTGGESYRLTPRTAGGMEVWKGDKKVGSVAKITCDLPSKLLLLERPPGEGDRVELCLAAEGLEGLLKRVELLTEAAGVVHDLQAAEGVRFRTTDGKEVRIELEGGRPAVYVNGSLSLYVTSVKCDVVKRRMVFDNQTRLDDSAAMHLPLLRFRKTLTSIRRICDAVRIPHQLDIADPIDLTTQDGAPMRICVEDGWPAVFRKEAFHCYVTQITADVGLRRLVFGRRVNPEDTDAIQLPEKGLTEFLLDIQSLCEGLGVPSNLCCFDDKQGAHWRLIVDENWPAAYRDEKFVQLITYFRWSDDGLRLVFERTSLPDCSEAVELPPHSARSILEAVAGLCRGCGLSLPPLPGAEEQSEDDVAQQNAAAKIQALHRGRRDRQRAEDVKKARQKEEEAFFEAEDEQYINECAKLIQGLMVRAFVRKVRNKVQQRKGASPMQQSLQAPAPPQGPSAPLSEADRAAAKIQALHRGRAGRQRAKDLAAEKAKEQEDFFTKESTDYEDYCARIIQNAFVTRFITKLRSRLTSFRDGKPSA
eukprot:Hpha_TRINITY_DN3657_c0_g1::TRINITY_DN3657_c0_g1_i1::g.970::m.970